MALEKLQRLHDSLKKEDSIVLGKVYLFPSGQIKLHFSEFEQSDSVGGFSIYFPIAPKEPRLTYLSMDVFTDELGEKLNCGDFSSCFYSRSPKIEKGVYFPASISCRENSGAVKKSVAYSAELPSPHELLGIDFDQSLLANGAVKVSKKKKLSKPIQNYYRILVYPDHAIMGMADPAKEGRVQLRQKGNNGAFISPELKQLAEGFYIGFFKKSFYKQLI